MLKQNTKILFKIILDVVLCWNKIISYPSSRRRLAVLKLFYFTCGSIIKLDGCIVWNAHNTVLGEEALLIYIVPVCYVKTGMYGKT